MPIAYERTEYILTDLLEAARRDPRYLPMLPTLFAMPGVVPIPLGLTSFTVVYDLHDVEQKYPVSLRRCQFSDVLSALQLTICSLQSSGPS
jgi:hypothetical protein